MTLRETLFRSGRKALIIPPVLLGVVILAAVVARREGPAKQSLPPVARTLHVIEVPQAPVVPRVLGYGTARPGEVWSAVAEVKGRVVAAHPELNAGAILSKGAEVLRIDDSEYKLQVARLEAEIAQIEAQQLELGAQEKNYNDSLKIERDSLELAKRDLEREKTLRATNAVTEASYEQTFREVLTQSQNVQSLLSQLNVLPAQQQALAANLNAKKASLGGANLDLDRTLITAPFDCRLGEVSLEVGQFLTAGQVLFEAHGSALTEVEAQMPIDQFRRLLAPWEEVVDLSGDPMASFRAIFVNVEATVRMRTGDLVVEWEGKFDRIREELDLQTRTLRIVIAVAKPYENVVPGKRPPLSPGMFCEVELRGAVRPDQVVIPRTSVHDGAVHLVDDENCLVRREVTLAFSQGAISVVAAGLQPGEILVVDDATPAVVGMLVEPKLDNDLAKQLVALAAGEGDVR